MPIGRAGNRLSSNRHRRSDAGRAGPRLGGGGRGSEHRVPSRRDGCGRPAVHSLHVRIDRKAQGGPPHHRRLCRLGIDDSNQSTVKRYDRTTYCYHPDHDGQEQDHHQKAEEHVEHTAIPHHPRAPIAFASDGKRWQEEPDEHGCKHRIAKLHRRSPDGTKKESSLTAGIGSQTFCIAASAAGPRCCAKQLRTMALTTHPQCISGRRQHPERCDKNSLRLLLPHRPATPPLTDRPLPDAALQADDVPDTAAGRAGMG